jgi:hypothetical protein
MRGVLHAKAARGELKNRFDVILRQSSVKLDEFINSQAIFKAPPTFPGTLSTAGHCDRTTRRFTKGIERFAEQFVRILKPATLDAFPHPTLDFRRVNLDDHGFTIVALA